MQRQYINLLPSHFEQMESHLDSFGHDLIEQLDLAYKKDDKHLSWELTDKFLQFENLLRQHLKELYPYHDFKNF